MDSGDRQRLATYVRKRRLELGLSGRAAAKRAGMAQNTWAGAEHGKQRTAEYHFAGIEKALSWAPGSVEAILAGGEPAEQHQVPSDEPAGDRAAVLQIVSILGTEYSAETKIAMIRDVIARDVVLADQAEEAEPRRAAAR